MMRAVSFAALSMLFLACTPAAAEPPFYGLAKAKDGDSLMVAQREVRLFGIVG